METVFKPNRQELEKYPTAKEALLRMDEILASKRPYSMIKEVEGLIDTTGTVNGEILEKRKGQSVQVLDEKINQVKKALAQIKSDPDLQNRALKPLQDIKKSILGEKSIPGIFYQTNMAEEELENALDLIETSSQKEEKKQPSMPVRYIQPAKVTAKNYLETQEDIEEFLVVLRKELEAALQEHVRIRIQ